jgi:pyruvate dehydrogenase kinase 2/3/4
MAWKKPDKLMDMVAHYANFVSHPFPPMCPHPLTVREPATGVSLRQMVQFGERPSTGECAAGPGRVVG